MRTRNRCIAWSFKLILYVRFSQTSVSLFLFFFQNSIFQKKPLFTFLFQNKIIYNFHLIFSFFWLYSKMQATFKNHFFHCISKFLRLFHFYRFCVFSSVSYKVIIDCYSFSGGSWDEHALQRDYSFDLSKYKTSATQLFHDRDHWFELNSKNAFLEFLFQVFTSVFPLSNLLFLIVLLPSVCE